MTAGGLKNKYPDWIRHAVRILARSSQMVGGMHQMDPAGVLSSLPADRLPARLVFWYILRNPRPDTDYLADVFDGPAGGEWIRVYRAKWEEGRGWTRAGRDHFISQRQIDVFLYGDLRPRALKSAKAARQMEVF